MNKLFRFGIFVIPISLLTLNCAFAQVDVPDETEVPIETELPLENPAEAPVEAAPSAVDFSLDELLTLDLEELMNLDVSTASLTGSKQYSTPASVTVITKEQIRQTPARNLYDLLEVYVPGALWMNHHEGPHLGMRGIIVDRNYKFLLLVNGVNMNQKAHNGATSELENWDLNDIEKIEVVRGPGSVTYGPGAVMGVINITTKNATEAVDGSSVTFSSNYASKYNSKGISLSNSIKSNDVSLYTYFSLQSTPGFVPTAYKVNNNNEYGYVGKDFGNDAQDYYADYQNNPQIKLHSQLNTEKGWQVFTRYTQSGSSANGVNSKSSRQIGYFPDSSVFLSAPYNNKQLQYQHFTLSGQKDTKFTEALSLKTSLTYDNENAMRNQSAGKTYALSSDTAFVFDQNIYNSVSDPNHVRLKKFYFSEEEISLQSVLSYKPSSKLALAIGGQFVHNTWRSPWGKDERSLRMGDGSDIISDTNSYAYGKESYFVNKGIYVGKGWSTNTVSAFGEVKYTIIPKLAILASGRIDKDTYSDFLISPRLGLISELNSKNALRLVFLESVRMNTAEQLYVQNLSNKKSVPEKIKSVELMYTGLPTSNLIVDASVYYNDVQVLGWSDNDSTTVNVGNLSLLGVELNLTYKISKFDVGFNHSFTKMIDWKLNDSIQTSGISYSDYNKTATYTDDNGVKQTIRLQGSGKSINNWSNNTSKIFVNYHPNEKFNFHLDAQIFYKFGNSDGIDMLSSALDTTTHARVFQSTYNKALNDVDSKGTYQTMARMNASVSYFLSDYVEIMLYVQSIPLINNNQRYTYDAGVNGLSPNGVGFVQEPTFYGAKLFWKF